MEISSLKEFNFKVTFQEGDSKAQISKKQILPFSKNKQCSGIPNIRLISFLQAPIAKKAL